MRLSIRISLFISAMLVLSSVAGAKEWPDEPDNVERSFGMAVNGNFSRGLNFRSEGQRIKAWSEGDVIWRSDIGILHGSVSEEGLVVVEHRDGFRSSYCGIEGRPDLNIHVSDDEWLGYAGDDFWVFKITDVKRSRIVDPITLLPSRIDLPPVSIGSVMLVRGHSSLEIEDEMELSPGRWTVVVNDSSTMGNNAIPMEISLYWVGERIGSFRFDALAETDEGIVMEIPDPRSFDFIYNPDGQLWFRDVLLNAGRGTLELRIKDEIGRVISSSWNLSIR